MTRSNKKGPAVYEDELDLGGFTFSPETYKPDGALKAPAAVTLQLIHQGRDPEALTQFFSKARGHLQVTIACGAVDPDEWHGIGTLGKASVDFPGTADRAKETGSSEHAIIRLPLKVAAQLDQRRLDALLGLMSFRAAMGAQEVTTATVKLQPWQEDLPLEGEGVDD